MPLQLYVSRQFCGSTKLVRKLKFKCLQFSAAVKITKKKKKEEDILWASWSLKR